METEFSHFDSSGNAVMVDVSEKNYIQAICAVKVDGKTGVEMEALTGVNVTLLTIYDMCKAIDKTMEISEVHLAKKTGGKSGEFINEK